MVLVDTSVWVDHLRSGDQQLADMLEAERVLMHPFVFGELALGNLQPRKEREEILGRLKRLPQSTVAKNSEVLDLIEKQTLFGLGIGYVDAHLLAAVALTPEAKLMARDKRMLAAAERLGLAFDRLH